ncbi:MAG: hypothetical protein JNL08_16175 [Planctomycetes bacterium]|nr:hypothetical protein [Planctomycetota bacterium]
MRSLFLSGLLGSALLAQTPPPAAAPTPAPSLGQVRYDKDGWPILPEVQAADPGPKAAATPAAPAAEARGPVPPSGMQLGSPLLDVYQSTRSPAAFKALGGIVVWWRLTIHGAQGEVIGVREITHTADCAFAERDRLEHADGRVYGRSAASVFAERQGMPWPTLNEAAAQELTLFGLHLRLPWCFGDGSAYVVTQRDRVDRGGEPRTRIALERRPAAGSDLIGPELDPRPRDRFELLYEPSTGEPRELVHRFASTQQARRVLLEDWRDVQVGEPQAGGAVRMPFRRVYVDEADRRTTQLEILRIESARVSERDFRLH